MKILMIKLSLFWPVFTGQNIGSFVRFNLEIKMTLPQLSYKSSGIPTDTPTALSTEFDKLTLQFTLKCKGLRDTCEEGVTPHQIPTHYPVPITCVGQINGSR